MPNKPIIAITVESQRDAENARSGGKIELNWNYAQMVSEAGGIPLVVPPVADMDEVASLVDGWLIPGGADLDSSLWGEPLHPKAELQDGSRFEAEKRLFNALDPRVPVLGICYGCQVLNVLRGGSLEQHLPDIVGNESHSGGTLQEYWIEEDSLLARTAGTTAMQGKSYHHQAVGKVAEGMRVVAQAVDGTIEAIEATDRPWTIGVQWHPERTPDDRATRRLFERFVAVADAYRTTKA
jgi:putative glutamine amidotransferase